MPLPDIQFNPLPVKVDAYKAFCVHLCSSHFLLISGSINQDRVYLLTFSIVVNLQKKIFHVRSRGKTIFFACVQYFRSDDYQSWVKSSAKATIYRDRKKSTGH